MSSNQSTPPSAGDDWRERECILRRFEDAWRRGERPDLDSFLPAGGEGRHAVLVELVHTDLEMRLAAGEAVTLGRYLARFPELAGDAGQLLDLIATEVRGRGVDGEAALQEYRRRFPGLGEQLTRRFAPPMTTPADRTAPAPAVLPRVPGYELLRELGRGGMGVVYLARQGGLDRLVALKMILSGEFAGAGERARFRAEARAVARLSHPNIVQVFEVGEHDGLPFLALEYIDCPNLAQQLAERPLEFRPAAGLLEALARAVQHAHEQGVVHRDLKPGNVLLATTVRARSVRDGPTVADAPRSDVAPKIADFGLAKRIDAQTAPTRTGAVVGTPAYMAPEQAEGKSNAIGPAADVWALGAILYECLTGRPPFQAETPVDTLVQVVSAEPTPPRKLQRSIPRDLETICLRCLQKEPGRRYPGALALAEDLKCFQGGEPIAARPVGRAERLWRWCRRKPLVAGLVTALAAALLAGGAIVYHNWAQRARDRASAREKDRARVRAAFARGEELTRKYEYNGAIAAFSEVIESDPANVSAYVKRADLYWSLRQLDQAIADCDEALERDLSLVDAYAIRAVACFDKGEYGRSVRDCTEVLRAHERLSGHLGPVLVLRSQARVMLEEWDLAADDYARGGRLRGFPAVYQESTELFMRAGCLLARGEKDDIDGYRKACAEMLNRFGDVQDKEAAYVTARACVLSPKSGVAPARSVELARRSEPGKVGYRLHTLGLAHYRAGELASGEEAAGEFRKAIAQLEASNATRWQGMVVNWLVLAMAHHRLGNTDQAQGWMGKACQLPPRIIYPAEAIAYQVLRREAEALIRSPSRK
jgi:tetratricopeptide (TPR) repeat protein